MTKSIPPKNLVLYADDDPEDIELVREAFHAYSNRIELAEFSNGIELLSFLKNPDPIRPKPCLIILDINMPEQNGKEVLRQIRTMNGYEEIPVVLFTTSTLPSEIAFAKSFGAGYVNKPLHTDQITMLVDEMIDHCDEDVKENIRRQRGK